MADAVDNDLYPDEVISFLEILWGEGFLSPGGPEEVARLVEGVDFTGRKVLDIGCGSGGIDMLLAGTYGAGHVTGIDVEDPVLATSRRRAAERGLADRIDFVKVEPGPFPFGDETFDIVFSKDSIVHIPDKAALMREVFRVLKPGGWFVASDWLVSHDGEPSPEMKRYIASEDLDFGMASPQAYRAAMQAAGFTDITLRNRNEWYRAQAREELRALKEDIYDEAVARLGKELIDHNVQTWSLMLVVLDKGEHCPHHLRGRKPEHGSK